MLLALNFFFSSSSQSFDSNLKWVQAGNSWGWLFSYVHHCRVLLEVKESSSFHEEIGVSTSTVVVVVRAPEFLLLTLCSSLLGASSSQLRFMAFMRGKEGKEGGHSLSLEQASSSSSTTTTMCRLLPAFLLIYVILHRDFSFWECPSSPHTSLLWRDIPL